MSRGPLATIGEARRFWGRWFLVHLLGGAIGYTLAVGAYQATLNWQPASLRELVANPVFSLGLIWGPLGTLQWWVLRPYLARPGGAWGVIWVLTGIAGTLAASVLSFVPALLLLLAGPRLGALGQAVALGLVGLLAGGVLGLAQGWLLARGLPGSRGWAGLSALGWGAGLGAAGIVTAAATGNEQTQILVTALDVLGATSAWVAVPAGTALVGVAGAITGLGLAWRLADPGTRPSLWRTLGGPALLGLGLLYLAAIGVMLARVTPPAQLATFSQSLSITAVAWSPDGRLLASGSQDTQAAIWDARTGEQRAGLADCQGSVGRLAWAPTGRYLAMLCDEPTSGLRIWETTTWQRLTSVVPLVSSATRLVNGVDLAWSPDGTRLALGLREAPQGGQDGAVVNEIRVYAVPTGQVVTTLQPESPLESLAWVAQGDVIAFTTSLTGSSQILVWALGGAGTPAPAPVRRVGQFTGFGGPFAWSPDGSRLAVGWSKGYFGAADRVALVDTATGQIQAELRMSEFMNSLAWSPDGHYLAVGTDPEVGGAPVTVWDVARQVIVARFAHPDRVYCLAWSPDGHILASGGLDYHVRLWRFP